MHRKLTPPFVRTAAAAAGAERTIYWDESLEGFGLMVTAAAHRSFVVQYRAAGTSRRYTIKGTLSLAKARKKARSILGAVAEGRDPLTERRKAERVATNTLRAISEEYLAREGKKLRSVGERRRIFDVYILPKLGSRQIEEIKRSDVVRLLDRIEDNNGPVMADHVLAVLRRLMTWHAGRTDDFRSPIVRGMARTKPKDRARERILSDDELRAVWAGTTGWDAPYGHLVRFILLTATRLREAAQMRRQEIAGTDWLIPAARHKSKRDFLLPLSKAACEGLAAVPTIGRRGWVFTTDGERPINGFSKAKQQLDARILEQLRKVGEDAKPLPRWTNHDLRRTARSLMSRAGISPDHAERALGHVISGVRGTYDRHEFAEEKRRAFEALALQIERIISQQDNVVGFRAAG